MASFRIERLLFINKYWYSVTLKYVMLPYGVHLEEKDPEARSHVLPSERQP
jgi:hypothetical protein